ncbi:MAG: TauD/TfdA family dioxygenase [Parvularculaceae bacterium]
MLIRAATAKTNASRKSDHIKVDPIAGTMGAEISGVDVRDMSAAAFEEIKTALADHIAVFILGQDLSVEEMERFTSRFGAFGDDPFIKGMDEHPHVLHVKKEAKEMLPVVFGGLWHSDWSFLEAPPAYTILHAKEIPPFGGDTLYANCYLAYEALSVEFRRILDGLTALHSAQRGYGEDMKRVYAFLENMTVKTGGEASTRIEEHPLVRTHPVTKRKALYVNPVYTVGIKGMDEEESTPILQFLARHMTHENFTCRFRWKPGAIAMWDNRACLHLPISDYLGFRREMYRTTVEGERPYL